MFIKLLNVYWALSTCQVHMRSILVLFCGRKIPQIYQFKTAHIYYLTVLLVRGLGWLGLFLCYRFHRAEIKVSVSAGLGYFLECWGMNLLPGSSGLLAETCSCSCRTEDLSPVKQLWSTPSTMLRQDISVSAAAGKILSSVWGGKGKCALWARWEQAYIKRSPCPWSLISPSSSKWRLQILI